MAAHKMERYLENLKIEIQENGRKKLVPALDPGWAENRQFIAYRPPPLIPDAANETLLVARQEQWMELVERLSSDLEYLLQLPHHRFWSQVVFDPQLQVCLDSYLASAIRSHDPLCYALTDSMRWRQQKVHRLVFFVYVRMATLEESDSCCISPAMFAKLIYENFLFDIPKLMDLCALYGRENKFAIQKMITNVFNNQPGYECDLTQAVDKLIQTITSIEVKFGLTSSYEDGVEPKKLSEYVQPVKCSDLSWKELLDMTFYLVDMWITLHNFLDVCPNAGHVFLARGFATRIASFYEALVPTFVGEFRARSSHRDVIPTLDEGKKRLSFARVYMLKVFRGILESSCFQPILENSCSNDSIIRAEEFLEVLTGILSDKTFVLDYLEKYPFHEDVDLLTQAEIELDSSRLQYVETSFSSIKIEADSTRRSKNLPKLPLNTTSVVNGGCTNTSRSTNVSDWYRKSMDKENTTGPVLVNGADDDEDLEGACAGPRVGGEKLMSLVSNVKDLIPDLSDGFVEVCLEHYNYDCEQVINALLEGSLPNSLDKLDRQLPRRVNVVKPKQSNVCGVPSLLAERRNVFDNDEFDVFSRDDVDKSRIHKGKKKEQWPDLPKHDSSLKSATIKLATEYDRNKLGDMIYDDEYDDTYDGNMIGPSELTGFDEFTDRRPFVVPRVLAAKTEVIEDDSRHIEERPPPPIETNSRPTGNDFCENPELARERYAQHRQQKEQNRGKQGNKDYQGKAKGQGQEATVLKNRTHKEKNKAFHGNHNRRSGSDYKRSRGMIPF